MNTESFLSSAYLDLDVLSFTVCLIWWLLKLQDYKTRTQLQNKMPLQRLQSSKCVTKE